MTTQELFEILQEDKPSVTLRTNEEELFRLIPKLEQCKGFDQKSIWHPYDVYEHILHVVDNVKNDKNLRTAALFHDIGKVDTFSLKENGQGSFMFHWEESVNIFREFLDKNDEKDPLYSYICYLIYFHDLRGRYLPEGITFLFGEEGIRDLYELKRADLLAQNPQFHYLLDEYNEEEKEIIEKCRKRSIGGTTYGKNGSNN